MNTVPVGNHSLGFSGMSRTPSRSLFSNIIMVFTQPTAFFQQLPSSRQWIWVALLLLFLMGFVSVRHPNNASTAGDSSSPPTMGGEMFIDPAMSGNFDGGGMGIDLGMPPMPTDGLGGDVGSSGGNTELQNTLTTGLIAASGLLLTWFIQAFLLCEVTLLKGQMPSLGRNLQIAVWASLPIGIMLILRLFFFSSGGTPVAPGLSSLLAHWDVYPTLSPLAQTIVTSFFIQLTLFGLWSWFLLYLGARHSLRGHFIGAVIVVLAWLFVITMVPVFTGQVEAFGTPDAELSTGFEDPMQPPMDFEISPDAPLTETMEMEIEQGNFEEGNVAETP